MCPAPDPDPQDRETFQAAHPVSRETLDRLTVYAQVLRHWQRRINLVSPGTLDHLWTRHFADSARLVPWLPAAGGTVVDLGSGAGFPGLVLALLTPATVHLVESDRRKAAFLREAARQTGAPVTVHACRVEALPPLPADVVTARALAPLPRLLTLAAPWLTAGARGLFPKGRTAAEEVASLPPASPYRVTVHPVTPDHPDGPAIIEVQESHRA